MLHRWGLSEKHLPDDARVLNREVTLWERYRGYFHLGLAALVVQSLAIATLVISRSQRLRAERSLDASRAEARQLSGKLLSAQENERKRLARELHDDLSQRLAAAAIEAGKLECRSDTSVAAQSVSRELKNDLISVADDVHRISRQLHPAILDDLGLPDALQSECDRLAERAQVDVTCRLQDDIDSLPSDISLCLYRIAQESLWNAAKHSKTDRMIVSLAADAEAVHLEIRDFGVGFNPTEVNGPTGLGMASMRERTRLVNGALAINSSPGSGTTISVSVPLAEETQ